MSSNMQFWLGLAFAIPLSVLANLVSPKIQDFLSKRFVAAARSRELQRTKEAERVIEYVNDSAKLNTYLLVTLIVATMFGAMIGVFTALLFILGTFSRNDLSTVLAQAMTVFSGLLITKICLDAVRIATKVRQEEKQRVGS